MKKLLIGFCLLLSGQCFVVAEPVKVEIVTINAIATTDYTEVVFHTTGPLQDKPKLFSLHSPDRLVMDVPRARLMTPLLQDRLNRGDIKGIRVAAMKEDTLRVVFDLQQSVMSRIFILQPTGDYGHRLVVRLQNKEQLLIEVTSPNPTISTIEDLAIAQEETSSSNTHELAKTEVYVDDYSMDRTLSYAEKIALTGGIFGGWLFLLSSVYRIFRKTYPK